MRRLLFTLILLLCRALPAAAETTHTFTRVISLAPSLTECVFAIGAEKRLVGVGDFDSYPPAVSKLRRCGGWSNPNFETIRGLNPDLLLVIGRHEKIRSFADSRGIKIESLHVETMADIPACMLRLGQLLGAEAGATSVSTQFTAELARFKAELAAQPQLVRPRVFVCIGRQEGALAGLTTITTGSFIDEALTLAGGTNVFADLKHYYPSISKEALLARKPDVIIELREGAELTPEQAAATAREWQSLAALPAVRNGRVHVLSAPGLLIPGPRFTHTIARLRRLLFPNGLGEKKS